MKGPCSICEKYAESASAYCCRQDVNDQRECSESELRVIWTPKASVFSRGLIQPRSSRHTQLKTMQSVQPIALSVAGIPFWFQDWLECQDMLQDLFELTPLSQSKTNLLHPQWLIYKA